MSKANRGVNSHRTTNSTATSASSRTSVRQRRSLVWINMEPLLEAERAQCRKTSDKLSALLKQMDVYRETDQPQYQQWLNANFGIKMTEIRELNARYSELEDLVVQVEDLAFWNDWTHEKAYEHLTQIRSGMKKVEELRREQSQDSTVESEQLSFEAMADQSPEIESMLRLMFSELVGPANMYSKREYARMFDLFKEKFAEEVNDRSEEERNYRDHQRRRSSHSEKADTAKTSARSANDSDTDERKQLYRALARRLHPDLNKSLSPQEKELWLEVQAAYDAGDLEKLQMVSATLEHGNESTSRGVFSLERVLSVSRLKLILKGLQKKLRSAQKAARDAKKQPSWEFSRIASDPASLQKMSDDVATELKEALSEIRVEMSDLEKKIKRWAPRQKSKPSEKKRPNASRA